MDNLRVVEEWPCFDDRDFRPKILQIFKYWSYVSRNTWTIRAEIT
ncbi:hypothetical protein [Candidatus Uabimicrobium amorphum]|nr:hypothetical protein [Candidatus Uabimicrobium amorphum]